MKPSTQANPEADKISDYPLFDWLRFLLASAVVMGHAHLVTWGHIANLAVQVFFALSGWLIGGILLRTEIGELPRFYFNRATRVWIPYLAAIILLYGLSALRDPVTGRWIEFLVYDITFTHNWFSLLPNPATAIAQMPLKGTGNHFWSLAVEEQFYLAAPLLMLFIRGGKSVAFWSVVAVIAYATQSLFGAISFGVLAAACRRDFGDWHLARLATAILLTGTVGGAVTMVSLPDLYQWVAPVFAIAVVLLAARVGQRTELGQFLGGMSYPLYLNHWLGAFVVHGLAKRAGIDMPLLVALASYVAGLVVGAVAYIAIDRQIMARRGAFYSPSVGTTLGGVAYGLMLAGVSCGLYFHLL
jgi:peptidoglycan/LPS O-acetylase OafA/YrhL